MAVSDAEKLFSRGLDALDQGNTVSALSFFEKASQMEDNPRYRSYLAYCVAKERGQHKLSVSLCEEAIAQEPAHAGHYLNLGRIYLISGKRAEALKAFREGMSHEADPRIIAELDRMGSRKSPPISFLNRNNPLNKYLGIVLRKVRLR
jgi:tetratricopeptide (TPR) repeat protein